MPRSPGMQYRTQSLRARTVKAGAVPVSRLG